MDFSKCNLTMWPRRISALSVIILTLLTIFFLGWNGVQRVFASPTQQMTRPLLSPQGILGLLTAIPGRGGVGIRPIGPEACGGVEILSGENFWLFPKEKVKSDGFSFFQFNDHIVAIRCGPPHSQPIQYTLTSQDEVILQETAELPLAVLSQNQPRPLIANDYFAYGMDWGRIARDIILTIEGDIKPISHTFHVVPTPRIYLKDWQTGIRKDEYNAGEQLYIELAGVGPVVDIVLYQNNFENIIPIQASQVIISEEGVDPSPYSLPDDLQPGLYTFVACGRSECTLGLGFGDNLKFPPIAIKFFRVTKNSVLVDPVTGFTGLRLLDLDNVRLELAEPGEELLRGNERRVVNGRTYAPITTASGTKGWVINRYLIEAPVEETYFDLTWCDPALLEVRPRLLSEDSCVISDSSHPIWLLEEWEAKLKTVMDGDRQIDLLADDESLAIDSVSGSTLRFAVQDERGVHNGWINIGTDVPHNRSPSPVSGVWRTDQNNRYVEPICWYRTDATWRCETAIGWTPWIR